MKRPETAAALLLALGMIVLARPAPAQVSVRVNLTIGTFYDELAPYGEWVDCRYGECWVPRRVGAGWQPYSNGEWVYTRYGWTWISSDPWGADPYHYGTWDFVDRYGWVWIPGTVWAPAWVTWSYSDRYVGWAPMPPTITFGASGYSGSAVVVNEARYVFVPTNRFVGTSVQTVRVEPRQNPEIFRQSKAATRFEVSGGILRNSAVPLETVQRATGSRIETREIDVARTTPRAVSYGGAGKGGHVAIVAPAGDVKAAHEARRKGAPQAAAPEPKHEQKQPQQQAQPRHEQQQPQQQAQPKHDPQQPQQQAQPRHEQQQQPQQQAKPKKEQKPADEGHGKSEDKKKDPPGKDEPHR
jgi:hypothetical protein